MPRSLEIWQRLCARTFLGNSTRRWREALRCTMRDGVWMTPSRSRICARVKRRSLPVFSKPAWIASIDTAEKFAPIGGYLVSRHFERLSQRDDAKDQAKLEAFRKREKQRQQRLKTKLDRDEEALEKLVDALQFCDLLSLYLCCGSKTNVVFSNPKVRLERDGEAYRISPNPFKGAHQFTFSALKHPLTGAKKRESGANFYINFG